MINDSNATGLAQMTFGAREEAIVLTVRIGGASIFVDGVLLPNTELGLMEIREFRTS